MLCVTPPANLGSYHTRFAQSLKWSDIDVILVYYFCHFDMVVSHWPSASHQLSHVLNYVLTFVLRSHDQLVVWSLYCQWERMLTTAAKKWLVGETFWSSFLPGIGEDVLEVPSVLLVSTSLCEESCMCRAYFLWTVGQGGSGRQLEPAETCFIIFPRLLYFSTINSGRSVRSATSSRVYLPWWSWPGCSVWY